MTCARFWGGAWPLAYSGLMWPPPCREPLGPWGPQPWLWWGQLHRRRGDGAESSGGGLLRLALPQGQGQHLPDAVSTWPTEPPAPASPWPLRWPSMPVCHLLHGAASGALRPSRPPPCRSHRVSLLQLWGSLGWVLAHVGLGPGPASESPAEPLCLCPLMLPAGRRTSRWQPRPPSTCSSVAAGRSPGHVCGLVFLWEGELLWGSHVLWPPSVLWGGSLQPPLKCLLFCPLPALCGVQGGVLSPVEVGPPPWVPSLSGLCRIWPPSGPDSTIRGKRMKRLPALGFLKGTQGGKNFGHQIVAPVDTEQTQSPIADIPSCPGPGSGRWEHPSTTFCLIVIPVAPRLVLGLGLASSHGPGLDTAPNKGALSSTVLYVPCLGLCVDWMGWEVWSTALSFMEIQP